MRLHAIPIERRRNDLASEIGRPFARQHLEQHVSREDVDAHRGDERLVRNVAGKDGARRDALLHLLEPRARGLFLECHDLAAAIEAEDAHRRCVVERHRLRRHGDVRPAIDVRVHELVEVHAVELIARENQIVVGVEPGEMADGLTDRVGGPLIPVRVVGRLFGREDFHESLTEQVHPIGLADVAVERRRIELRQDEDPPDIRVQAVADRDVDEPVLPADRARPAWSGAASAERGASPAAAENEGENFRYSLP